MSEMLSKIQDAVRAALPAHLSEELQTILRAGDRAREEVQKLVAVNSALKDDLTKHQALETQRMEVIKRESTVLARETAVMLRELKAELNEFKVAAATQRVDDLKAVTLAVFANNQYKYERQTYGNQAVAMPSGSCLNTASVSSNEKIVTEG